MKRQMWKVGFVGLAALFSVLIVLSSCTEGFFTDLVEDAPETASYSVSVVCPGGEVPSGGLARGMSPGFMSDGNVTSVVVEATDAAEQTTSGALTKGASSWAGTVSVANTGLATFRAYAKNSSGSVLYYGTESQNINSDDDSVSITVSAVPANLSYDFSSDPGWTCTGDWEWGTLNNAGGLTYYPDDTYGTCYGTNIDGTYTPGIAQTVNYLQTGPIDLSGYPDPVKLKFSMFFDTDNGIGDAGGVLISTDGTTFTKITFNVTGDNATQDSSGTYTYSGFAAEGDLTSMTDDFRTTWASAEASLDAYASSSTLYIRWAFDTSLNSGAPKAGWYIDNVEIGSFTE
jgi:hypothetical protein